MFPQHVAKCEQTGLELPPHLRRHEAERVVDCVDVRGEYARRVVRCEADAGAVTVTLGAREGSFAPGRERVVLELRGVGGRPASVAANGTEPDWSFDEASGTLAVTLPEGADETTVTVSL